MNPIDNNSFLVNNVQPEQNHQFYQLARPYSPGSERSISSYNTPDINSHYSSEEGLYRAYQASRRRSNTLPDMYPSNYDYCIYPIIPRQQQQLPPAPQQQPIPRLQSPLQNQIYYQPPLPQLSESMDQPDNYWLDQRLLALDIIHDSNISFLQELLTPYQAKVSYTVNSVNATYHVIIQFKDARSIESAYYQFQNKLLHENEQIQFTIPLSTSSSPAGTIAKVPSPNPQMNVLTPSNSTPSVLLSPTALLDNDNNYNNIPHLQTLPTNPSSLSRQMNGNCSDSSVTSISSTRSGRRSYSDTHLLNAEAQEFCPHFLQQQQQQQQQYNNNNSMSYYQSQQHLLSSSSTSISSTEVAQALSVMSQPSHLQINTEMYSEFYPSSTTPHNIMTPSSPQSQSLSIQSQQQLQQNQQQQQQQSSQLLNPSDYTASEWTYLNSASYIDPNTQMNYIPGITSPTICSRRNSYDQIQIIPSSASVTTLSSPQQQQQQQQKVGSITASGRVRASHYENDTTCYNLDINKVANGEDTRTTLMIRNIPNKYNQTMLLAEINCRFIGTYDFFYLPIDFKNSCNVGYAFINFINPMTVIPFYKEFNNRKWNKFNSEKICDIKYGRIQGKEGLINHFRKSAVINVEEPYRPLLFKSNGPNVGEYEPFPIDCYNTMLK